MVILILTGVSYIVLLVIYGIRKRNQRETVVYVEMSNQVNLV